MRGDRAIVCRPAGCDKSCIHWRTCRKPKSCPVLGGVIKRGRSKELFPSDEEIADAAEREMQK